MLWAFLAAGRMSAERIALCLGEVSFLDRMVYLGKVGLVGNIDSFCNIVTLSAKGAGKG